MDPRTEKWRDRERWEKYHSVYPGYSNDIVALVQELAPPDAPVLEVGCNCGQHLWALQRAGQTALYGVDINREALQATRSVYPALKVRQHLLDVQETPLPFADKTMAVTFTHGTMMHLFNPIVFDEIVRVTSGGIVFMEDDTTKDIYFNPWEYEAEMKKRGWKLLKTVPHHSYSTLKARVFLPLGGEEGGIDVYNPD